MRSSRPFSRLLASLLAVAFAAILAAAAGAQGEPAAAPPGFVSPLEPLDTSTPRATMAAVWALGRELDEAYVAYRQAPSFDGQRQIRLILARASSLFDLRDTAPAVRSETGASSFGFLKDVLARLPAIDPAALAGEGGTAPARTRLPGSEIDIVRVSEGADRFVFSAETVARLPEFHRRIIDSPLMQPAPYQSWREEQVRFAGPFVPAVLTRVMPAALEIPVLDTPVWKIFAIVATFALAFWLASLWAQVRNRQLPNAGPIAGQAWRLTMPLVVGGLALVVRAYALGQINPAGSFFQITQLVTLGILIVAGASAARLVVTLCGEWIIAKPGFAEQVYDMHLVRLIARVAGILAAVGVILYGANEMGVPVLGLVAGMGVGGIALALAAQSTVENLFGGVSLFADRPFRVGDFIIYNGGRGEVESIGTRSTRIRSDDGMQITVPNADLAKMQVINKTCRDVTLFHHVVGLRHGTTRSQLADFCRRMMEVLETYPVDGQSDPPPRVRVVALGPSSIDVEIRAELLAESEDEYFRLQESLLLAIMAEVEAGGLAFAFPSRTIHFARDTSPRPVRDVPGQV